MQQEDFLTLFVFRHHALLLRIDVFQLFHESVKVVDHSNMVHKDFAALGRQHRRRCARHAYFSPDFPFFIREYGKGNPEIGLKSICLLLVVQAGYSYDFDVFGQTRIILNQVVEPVNYRRVLGAHRSQSFEELDQDKL
jgi:hypothetical protein